MHPSQAQPDPPREERLVRLNKVLADRGIASRRRCDELIARGKVSVDGEPVTELGTKIDPSAQTVEVDGVVLRPEPARRRYYLLNKPRGVVCTNEPRELRPRAIDLIRDSEKGRIFTVGRLDEDSEGLILLTNDGEFANRIAHPSHGVTKTYLAKVRGRIDTPALERMRAGVRLAEGRTGGARVRLIKRTSSFSTLAVTLEEGKNREVRRIFAKVGFNVIALKRTHIGHLSDRRLKPGQWRPLLRRELEELEALARGELESATPRKPRAPRGAPGRKPAPPRKLRRERASQRPAGGGTARGAERALTPRAARAAGLPPARDKRRAGPERRPAHPPGRRERRGPGQAGRRR